MRRLVLAAGVVVCGAIAAMPAGAQQIPNPVHVYRGAHGEVCFYFSEQMPTCLPVTSDSAGR